MGSPVVLEIQIPAALWVLQQVKQASQAGPCCMQKPQRSLEVPCHFPFFLRLLLLKLPLLVFVSRGTTLYLCVGAALWCAVSGDTHVRVRVVDGPIL